MLRLRQNERYRAFGMVAAGTTVIYDAKLLDCSSVIVHRDIVSEMVRANRNMYGRT